MNGMLDLIVARVRSLTGANAALVLQWTDDRLTARAASGLDATAIRAVALADDESLESWVARNNAPMFIPDLRREPSLHTSITGDDMPLALAALPLRASGDVVGVLEVRGTGATNFVANAPLLLAMADVVAAALADDRPGSPARRLGAPGFVRALTHDLKSPLTAIRGHAQLLERRAIRSGATGEATTAATIIGQVQRMTDLLNAVADAGLAEEGSLVLQTAPLDAVALVRRAAESLHTTAGQRVVVVAPQHELPVEGDEARLSRVIATLVGNALLRSRAGGCVEVAVARQGAEIVVSVQGKDAGGAPAGLPHIFDWTYQSSADPNAAPDLALYSAQRMIEAHHGRLWATSSPDGGTAFAFSLPAAQASRPQPPP